MLICISCFDQMVDFPQAVSEKVLWQLADCCGFSSSIMLSCHCHVVKIQCLMYLVVLSQIPDTNPCSVNNGGCDQLCFVLPNATEPTCACATGSLQTDERTCGGLYSISCGLKAGVVKGLTRLVGGGSNPAVSIHF